MANQQELCFLWHSLFEDISNQLTYSNYDNEYQTVSNIINNNPNAIRRILQQLEYTNKEFGCTKSEKIAAKLKLSALSHYQKGAYHDAIDVYNDMLKHVPRSHKSYSGILFMRAKALMKVEKYNSAVKDLCLSLNLNYRSKEAALFKIAECYSKLNRFEEFDSACCELKKLVSNTTEALSIKINNLKFSTDRVNAVEHPADDDLKLVDEMVNLPGASSKLALAQSDSKGRYIVANSDIIKNDVIFVEKPFAFVTVPLEDTRIFVCENCSISTNNQITCVDCVDSHYCSEECRLNGWERFHVWECAGSQIGLWSSIGIAHLAFRTLVAGLRSVNASDLKDVWKKLKDEHPDIPQDYIRIYKLNTNFVNLNENDIKIYTISSITLALYMKNYTDFFKVTSEESLIVVSSLIFIHILQMICNSSSVTRRLIDEDEDTRVIGTGIYPSSSMMNHSCLPNTVNRFTENAYFVAQAKDDIKKGTEVFNCYGVSCHSLPTETRKSMLKYQYGFDCKCMACEKYD